MYMIVYSILLFVLGVVAFTAYVLWRALKIEKVHKQYAMDCARLSKALDDERIKLCSMYLDAKAEGRAYRMRREKLEQYLKEGLAKFMISADQSELLCLDQGETDLLCKLLSKLGSKEPVK